MHTEPQNIRFAYLCWKFDGQMEIKFLDDIKNLFKNLVLSSTGAQKSIYEYLEKKEVGKVLSMMACKDTDTDEALKEYNPELHDVMKRPNKRREGEGDYYITEKLPRTREKYINEVELFFLFGAPIKWKKDDGDDEAYKLFTDYLSSTFFNAKIRQCKRLAGAETISALVTHFRQDEENEGKMATDVFVVARSTGYKIKYLFDQYKRLIAFAYGYTLVEGDKNVEHWDILTPLFNYECRKVAFGWEVNQIENPTKKINAIIFIQPKAWAGAEARIKRDEMLDSKIGDTNNYYADPIAAATADVIQSLPDIDKPGRLIQMPSEKSQFKYLDPPQDSATRRDEKDNLNRTILFDTFTPDFSFENMKGLGTISGVAIRNAMILGYIKRANRLEVYEEMITRFLHLTMKVLTQIYPDKVAQLDKLKVSFEFQDPFPDDATKNWQSIVTLYQGGLVSLETAVTMLALTEAPEEEIQRLQEAAAEKMAMEAQLKNPQPNPEPQE